MKHPLAPFIAGLALVVACPSSDRGDDNTGPFTTDRATSNDDTGVSDTTFPTTSDCIEIATSAFQQYGPLGVGALFEANVSPGLGGAAADTLSLQFYSSYDPYAGTGLDGEVTGTFELGTGGDANYATCSRCVLVFQDSEIAYFATSGTLTIDDTSAHVQEGLLHGALSDVTFEEVTIEPYSYVSRLVSGGGCLHLAEADLTYVPPPPIEGWTCYQEYYADGMYCDCGCAVPDPDCADATVGSCDYCDGPGSCNGAPCPGTIDPNQNETCLAP